jgi:DNA helicase-2/ATP-dependent DNA helicase PcrA
MSLNAPQARAVSHRSGHLLVLAGAGTGKTRVLTHRIASLAKSGTPTDRILAVTFTNKAAREMQRRTTALGVPDGAWIGTFHSVGLRVLKRHADLLGYTRKFSVYDDDAQVTLIKSIWAELPSKTREAITPRMIAGHISYAKDSGLGPDQLADTPVPDALLGDVRTVFAKYEQALKAADAMDFADLLGNTVKILRKADGTEAAWLLRKFAHVLVDEFQDTNRLQMAMADLLATNGQICVVGDDDQVLYSWRGADPMGLLRFSHREGVEVVRLEDNYRSTRQILDCANALIAHNAVRLGKTLRTTKTGPSVRLTRVRSEREEAEYVAGKVTRPWESNAVLYRTHAQSRVLEEALRRRGVPYKIIGGWKFYDRLEIKDLLSYFRLALNPRSDVDLLRVANRPARGIGPKRLEGIRSEASRKQVSIFDVLEWSEDISLAPLLDTIVELGRCADEPLDIFYARVLEITGYRRALEDAANRSQSTNRREEALSKLENVDELAGDLASWMREHRTSTLESYLEHVALVSSFDDEADAAVSLMTIHAAKGLEFPRVFLVGFEEGILPHASAVRAAKDGGDQGHIEEERRLAYVAITRAMDVLEITLATTRQRGNTVVACDPSRFIDELPVASLEMTGFRAS